MVWNVPNPVWESKTRSLSLVRLHCRAEEQGLSLAPLQFSCETSSKLLAPALLYPFITMLERHEEIMLSCFLYLNLLAVLQYFHKWGSLYCWSLLGKLDEHFSPNWARPGSLSRSLCITVTVTRTVLTKSGTHTAQLIVGLENTAWNSSPSSKSFFQQILCFKLTYAYAQRECLIVTILMEYKLLKYIVKNKFLISVLLENELRMGKWSCRFFPIYPSFGEETTINCQVTVSSSEKNAMAAFLRIFWVHLHWKYTRIRSLMVFLPIHVWIAL